MTDFLLLAFIFLVAGVVTVPLAARLGLGSVIGYLLAGIFISPFLVLLGVDVVSIQHFAEFGVVMMLFLVGLDLTPRMIWDMRSRLLWLGGGQIVMTTLVVALVAMAIGLSWPMALATGVILSMSSTAIVLQTLKEKGQLQSEGGQSSFLVLLSQVIAVIPILAFMPLLAQPELVDPGLIGVAEIGHAEGELGGDDHGAALSLVEGLNGWQTTLVTFTSVGFVVLSGRYLTAPIFRFVAVTKLRELFTATALLLVIGISLLMSLVGLSPALGTFLAGVVLANSEYRHELEAVVDPFRGLLLGVFFITVGAGINFELLYENFSGIVAMTLGLIAVKAMLLFGLAWALRIKAADRWLFAVGLAQAGEFGFVLLSFAVASSVLPSALGDHLSLVVALSMVVTPFLFHLVQRMNGQVDRVWAEGMTVFLSYSRNDLQEMTAIAEVLRRRGFTVTSDERDLPFGEEWKLELSHLIRQSDVVIWLASHHSVTSEWCNWELGEVARFRKKMAPVVVGEISHDQLPGDIRKIQLLPGQGVFNIKRRDHIDALVGFLGSDAAWIKTYSRLSDRAHAWDEAARNGDRLLSLAELQDAESWQRERPHLAPEPEPLLLDFIHSSRISMTQSKGAPRSTQAG